MLTQISDVVLSVDGEEVGLTDFIKSNVVDDPQISLEELVTVLSLKPGRTVCLHIVDIKRIK